MGQARTHSVFVGPPLLVCLVLFGSELRSTLPACWLVSFCLSSASPVFPSRLAAWQTAEVQAAAAPTPPHENASCTSQHVRPPHAWRAAGAVQYVVSMYICRIRRTSTSYIDRAAFGVRPQRILHRTWKTRFCLVGPSMAWPGQPGQQLLGSCRRLVTRWRRWDAVWWRRCAAMALDALTQSGRVPGGRRDDAIEFGCRRARPPDSRARDGPQQHRAASRVGQPALAATHGRASRALRAAPWPRARRSRRPHVLDALLDDIVRLLQPPPAQTVWLGARCCSHGGLGRGKCDPLGLCLERSVEVRIGTLSAPGRTARPAYSAVPLPAAGSATSEAS